MFFPLCGHLEGEYGEKEFEKKAYSKCFIFCTICKKIIGIAINYGNEGHYHNYHNAIYAYLIQDKEIFDNLNNQDLDIDKVFEEVKNFLG